MTNLNNDIHELNTNALDAVNGGTISGLAAYSHDVGEHVSNLNCENMEVGPLYVIFQKRHFIIETGSQLPGFVLYANKSAPTCVNFT